MSNTDTHTYAITAVYTYSYTYLNTKFTCNCTQNLIFKEKYKIL